MMTRMTRMMMMMMMMMTYANEAHLGLEGWGFLMVISWMRAS